MIEYSETFSESFTSWATQSVLDTDSGAALCARMSILDTMACMVLGTKERQSLAATNAMSFGGSSGQVRPVGGGEFMTVTGAAMVNGARAHATDFDDYEAPGSTHPSASLLGALFSVVYIQPMTIAEICYAWIVGYEAICWIGAALGYGHYDRGWHASSTLGPIGTAAAVSRALGLSQTQMANAMALATSTSSGMKAQFGTDAKALHVGMAAQNGVFAALLAQGNTTGNINIWDAKQGFLDLFGTCKSVGFREAIKKARLGEATKIFPVSRKLWPSCAYTHRVIHGSETLHKRILDLTQVETIKIRMPEPFHRVASFLRPTTDAEARFSVSYCTVAGLCTGHVSPEDFGEKNFKDPFRQQLINKIEFDLYELPDEYSGTIGADTPEKISVKLISGERINIEIFDAPGTDQNPMTIDQLMQKVEDCGCSRQKAQKFLEAKSSTPFLEIDLLD